jgi:hypothetical protein
VHEDAEFGLIGVARAWSRVPIGRTPSVAVAGLVDACGRALNAALRDPTVLETGPTAILIAPRALTPGVEARPCFTTSSGTAMPWGVTQQAGPYPAVG